MSYVFNPNDSVSGNVRTVAAEQLHKALVLLTQQPDGLNEAVHDARKCFKRTRALYRFIKPAARDFQVGENARIRDIAGNLSAMRDAAALVENIQYLRKQTSNRADRTRLEALGKALEARRDEGGGAVGDRVRHAVDGCEAALVAVRDLKLKGGDRLIAKGWRRTLERARVALDACDGSVDDERFHDLRKRIQDYRFALEFLAPAWPSAFDAKHTLVKTLSDHLGHLNDMAVLRELLDREPDLVPEADRTAVLGLIDSQRADQRRKSLKLARCVLCDTPKAESRIVKRLWRQAG